LETEAAKDGKVAVITGGRKKPQLTDLETFYIKIGQISETHRRSIEVARLFGLFRTHGFEEEEVRIPSIIGFPKTNDKSG
jgi:hypothetical protein